MGKVDDKTKHEVFSIISAELWIDDYEVDVIYEDFNAK